MHRPTTGSLRQLSVRPRLYVADDFLSQDELTHLLTLTAGAHQDTGLQTKHDKTGLSYELPVAGDGVVREVVARIEAIVGFRNALGRTLRYRRYSVGEAHPPHLDCYDIGGASLVATAMLCLQAPEEGGETEFPSADANGLAVKPVAGRLVLWFNYAADGSPEPSAKHAGLPVRAGEKITLTDFVYASLDRAADVAAGVAAKPASRTQLGDIRFHCVNDGVPAETTDLLRTACDARGIEYVEVFAPGFDFEPTRRLRSGDLLYRPAVSSSAVRVEQFLYADGVASLYAEPDGIYFACSNGILRIERASVPVARTIPCATTDRSLLRGFVERLGGFPVVVKMQGGSGGVVRVDSFPTLFSVVDYALARSSQPLLCSYVRDAVHWRVIVIGDRAVAACRNPTDVDDFRSYTSSSREDYFADVEPALAAAAVRAARAVKCEMAGIDVLADASGRLFVIDANFPCYFPDAQETAGVDIAGMMVEHLLAKRHRLLAAVAATG